MVPGECGCAVSAVAGGRLEDSDVVGHFLLCFVVGTVAIGMVAGVVYRVPCDMVGVLGFGQLVRARQETAAQPLRGGWNAGGCRMIRCLRGGARGDLVSDRSAPCAQVSTPDRHRWKSANRLRGSSPRVCNFRLSRPCNFRLTLTTWPDVDEREQDTVRAGVRRIAGVDPRPPSRGRARGVLRLPPGGSSQVRDGVPDGYSNRVCPIGMPC